MVGIVNGYATVAEVKGWVGLSDSIDDAVLEDVISAASRWVDQYCGRQFYPTAAGTARVFDSCDGLTVDLSAASAVTAVKTDDNLDGTFETTWAASDYQLLPVEVTSPEARPYDTLSAVASRRFPLPLYLGRVGLVQVTGTFGYPAIPEDIGLACRMQAARLLGRRKSPEGVAGWGDFGPMRIQYPDKDVSALLDPYRIYAVA